MSLPSPISLGVYVGLDNTNQARLSTPLNYQLRRFDTTSGEWVTLPTIWDDINSCLVVETNTIGNFILTTPEKNIFLPMLFTNSNE